MAFLTEIRYKRKETCDHRAETSLIQLQVKEKQGLTVTSNHEKIQEQTLPVVFRVFSHGQLE